MATPLRCGVAILLPMHPAGLHRHGAPAVANVVFNTTGKRAQELPGTPAKWV